MRSTHLSNIYTRRIMEGLKRNSEEVSARESHTELANVVEGVERQGSLVSRGVVLLDAQSPSGSTGAVLIISGSTGAVLIVLVGRTKHAPAERVAITGPAQQPHHRRRR